MKELINKAGDLAIINCPDGYRNGDIVECVEYIGYWIVVDRRGFKDGISDKDLIPLGGEHVLVDEPKPELGLGDEVELESKE